MNLDELKKTMQNGDRIIFTFGAYLIRANGKSEQHVITADPAIRSDPPNGLYQVTNLYVDKDGKLVVEYDDRK